MNSGLAKTWNIQGADILAKKNSEILIMDLNGFIVTVVIELNGVKVQFSICNLISNEKK